MKPCLVKLASLSTGALMATHAWAQVAAPPAAPAAPPAPAVLRAAAGTQKPPALAATARATPTASLTMVTAAGSVIILADGIVTGARIAPIEPPAPGFVYER